MASSTDTDAPYSITSPDGTILARFADETERDEALLTGDYPDDAEPAYENEFSTPESWA